MVGIHNWLKSRLLSLLCNQGWSRRVVEFDSQFPILIDLYTLVSSSYNAASTSGRSFINKANRTGPRWNTTLWHSRCSRCPGRRNSINQNSLTTTAQVVFAPRIHAIVLTDHRDSVYREECCGQQSRIPLRNLDRQCQFGCCCQEFDRYYEEQI